MMMVDGEEEGGGECVRMMTDEEEEEEEARPSLAHFKPSYPLPERVGASDCLSLKSDWSKERPPNFSLEPETNTQSDCLSLKSDWSKERPPNFSLEPETNTQRRKTSDAEERKKPWRPPRGRGAGLQEVLEEHKRSLRRRCERVTEGGEAAGGAAAGGAALLNRIYTELYITEGLREEVPVQHEVSQLETDSQKEWLREAPIRVQEVFRASSQPHRPIRVVLTCGVAGVGKTFSVLKFCLDWAEGLENQDVDLLVLVSFRELNLVREQRLSLLQLLHVFHPTLEELTAEQLEVCRLLFILDGLDESRLPLDFSNMELLSDVSQKSSVNLLLTNLIQGNLLPSALVWITSRPAAANQIPPRRVDRLTEVRGFSDSQKEEYFRRRFSDEELRRRILSHIQTSRSLHIMCGVPVFCWISATVLEDMLTRGSTGELPSTLTDMYAHFVLVQTRRKNLKYQEGRETSPQELLEADREVLLKLGRLAYQHLEEGNIMFYLEDLQQCGLEEDQASLYSGVCTQIFRRETGIFQKPVYCFVHLSVQEFLAAVFMFHSFTTRKMDVLDKALGDWRRYENFKLEDFLIRFTERSLKNENGHMDLFLRFLHGLLLPANQKLLGPLLGWPAIRPEIVERVIDFLKRIKMYGSTYFWGRVIGTDLSTMNMSLERSVNVFHCLTELNDQSVSRHVREFLRSENPSEFELSEIHCSALSYILQTSYEVLEEFDLSKYKTSLEGRLRLIPAVRNCRTARLSAAGLAEVHCEVVASALKSSPSHLTWLALRFGDRQGSAVELLRGGLESPNCRLEHLRLERSSLPNPSYAALIRVLRCGPTRLKHLDLRYTRLGALAQDELCQLLKSPDCSLESLGLRSSQFGECLYRALSCGPAHLRHLDLSSNYLYDEGVKQLGVYLQSRCCRLETLRLSSCHLTATSGAHLAAALGSNPAHLKLLKLSYNHKLQDEGVAYLCDYLRVRSCSLETLRLEYCTVTSAGCAALHAALTSSPTHLKHLHLSKNKLQHEEVAPLLRLVDEPLCSLQTVTTLPLTL